MTEPEKSAAYHEGVDDRRRNGDDAECPYPPCGGDSADRTDWWRGCLDERNKRLYEMEAVA